MDNDTKRKADLLYKDKTRHGGKRKELLDRYGPVCFFCGQIKEKISISAHHIFDSSNHDFQILLCRSCHGKIHGTVDKRPVNIEDLINAISSSETLRDAAQKLRMDRGVLYKKRKKYGLFNKPCSYCQKEFAPTTSLLRYCSEECAEKGKQEKLAIRQEHYRNDGRKSENDKHYRERHREEVLRKKSEWQEKNKDRLREYRKEYYLKRKALRQNS